MEGEFTESAHRTPLLQRIEAIFLQALCKFLSTLQPFVARAEEGELQRMAESLRGFRKEREGKFNVCVSDGWRDEICSKADFVIGPFIVAPSN